MEKQNEMKKYSWKEEYNVDIESIDKQHQKMLENLNRLADIINKKECREHVSEIFFSLVHFAENYFTKEEILFKDYKYPNFSMHKEAHNNFIQQIIKFQEDYKNDVRNVCIDLYHFLDKWFNNHILEYDKDAVKFLKEKGL